MTKNGKKQVTGLATFPERCRVVPELRDHGINIYREMVLDPWRILYQISGSKEYVLSVFDSRQYIEDLLFKRMTGHII